MCGLTNSGINQGWNAIGYHYNSSIQLQASKELLNKISFRGDEKVLDIGCGDGKITAMISSYIPNGKITGIDASSDMILFASKHFSQAFYKNVLFQWQDATTIQFKNEFDLVFSSFALHWIIDFRAFLEKISTALTAKGKIAFTIPLGISTPLEQATKEIMQNYKWRGFFSEYVELWRFSTMSEYESMLLNAGFNIASLKEISQKKVFNSRGALEDYIIQWYPYMNYIEDRLKERFFKEIVDRYLEIDPETTSGTINFIFPRTDILAYKQ